MFAEDSSTTSPPAPCPPVNLLVDQAQKHPGEPELLNLLEYGHQYLCPELSQRCLDLLESHFAHLTGSVLQAIGHCGHDSIEIGLEVGCGYRVPGLKCSPEIGLRNLVPTSGEQFYVCEQFVIRGPARSRGSVV